MKIELYKIRNYSKSKTLLFIYLIINTINISNSLKRQELININIPQKIESENKNNDNKDIYYNLENSNANLNRIEFNKFETISIINEFPLQICSKLPFTKKDNFTDLLFNIVFKRKDNNNYGGINDFSGLEIKATITNNDNLERIKDNIINNSDALNTKVDSGTKTGLLKINKAFINKTVNSADIKDNDDLYLYLIINNKTETNLVINNDNLFCEIFLIYDDYNHDIIKNVYISNKIDYDENNEENNYKFYRLKMNELENSDKFIVDFSSNYVLSRGLYLSFINSDDKKKIKKGDIPKNSSNVEFLHSEIQKGKIHHFEFKLKDNKNETFLCIFAKTKILKTYNFIFKFREFNSLSYKFNNKVTYNNKEGKSILVLQNPFKDYSASEYIVKDIVVRKILKNDKIKKEYLDTIGIIESKYELVEKKVNSVNSEKIEIEIPKINEKDYYSIIINLYFPNNQNDYDALVYNTIDNHKIYRPYWAIFVFYGPIPFYLGIMAVVIVFASKKRKSDLKEEIMTTSFKISTANEHLKRDIDENEEDYLLE